MADCVFRRPWRGLSALALAAMGSLAVATTAQAAEGAGLWERDTLTGDWGGARTTLADQGITVNLAYLADTFGNVSGGLRQGATYLGRVDLQTNLDLDKLVGWQGATFHVGAYQIHGRGLSAKNLGNLLPVSNAEANDTTRLFTLWLEQSLLNDKVSVRAGQLAADDEFITSPTAGTLVNGTFGWMALVASDLPSGGPAYPLATPGLRVKVDPRDNVSLLAAVFSGDPAGHPGAEDPQAQNRHGTTFSLRGGALAIGEAQYSLNKGKDAAGLPGVYKLGGWYHSGTFDDLRRDTAGGSLAAPGSTGVPQRHGGSYGIYAVADQMIWRQPGTEDQGANLFLRTGAAPSDRNLVDFYIDGGVGYKGLIPGRAEDQVTLGAAYAHISRDARHGAKPLMRSHEAAIELTYSAAVAPWLHLQPDLQYIFNPGGNVADPDDPSRRAGVGDAFVLGLRTAIAF